MQVHPTLTVENEQERLQKAHNILKARCQGAEADRTRLEAQVKTQEAEMVELRKGQEHLRAQIAQADEKARQEKAQLLREAEVRLRDAVQKCRDVAEERYNAAMEAMALERSRYEATIDELQETLDIQMFGAGGKKKGDQRVVPRGKGVLCIGCLRQMVHRDVRQLPPIKTYTSSVEYVDGLKQKFFDSTMQAALRPEDELMSIEWQRGLDPNGLAPMPELRESPQFYEDFGHERKPSQAGMKRPQSLASLKRPDSQPDPSKRGRGQSPQTRKKSPPPGGGGKVSPGRGAQPQAPLLKSTVAWR